MTYKERKQCTACRYMKCLKVGMRKDLVLSEEQKKERFKIALRRKRRKLQTNKIGREESNSTKPNLIEEAKLYKNMPPLQLSKPHLHTKQLLRMPKLIPLRPQNHVGNSVLNDFNTFLFPKLYQNKCRFPYSFVKQPPGLGWIW